MTGRTETLTPKEGVRNGHDKTRFEGSVPIGAVPVREALLNPLSYERFFAIQMGALTGREPNNAMVISFIGIANVQHKPSVSFGLSEGDGHKEKSAGLSLRITKKDQDQVVELVGLPGEDPLNVTDATIVAIPGDREKSGEVVFKLEGREGTVTRERVISIQTKKNSEDGLHTHVESKVSIDS